MTEAPSLFRRLGRAAMGLLRPAAAPVLRRVDRRLQFAVAAPLAASQAALAESVGARLQALQSSQDEMFEALLTRLDAMSLSQLRSKVFAMEMAKLEARLAMVANAPPDASPLRCVVVGAGPHARVVVEAARSMGGLDLMGLVDPAPPGPMVLGIPVLGDDALLGTLRADVPAAILGIGANRVRERLGLGLLDMGYALPPVIHRSAQVSPSARIGRGVVVMAHAVVGTDVELGDFAVVNTGAIIDHDGVIGRAAHVAPGAALAGDVHVGDRSLVGVGAAIRPGIRIGADAVIGAGAAVVGDRPTGETAAGVPARRLAGPGGLEPPRLAGPGGSEPPRLAGLGGAEPPIA